MKYLFIIGTILFILNETYDNKFLKIFNKIYKYGKFLSIIVPMLYYFYDPSILENDFKESNISKLFNLKKNRNTQESSSNFDPMSFLKNTKVKRNVNESTKKFVASSQEWKCKNCNNLFDATYEIDHKTPLYKGGTNDINNLEALCRNCHGKKTLLDKIN